MTESQYDELLSEIQEEQRLRFKRLRAQMGESFKGRPGGREWKGGVEAAGFRGGGDS